MSLFTTMASWKSLEMKRKKQQQLIQFYSLSWGIFLKASKFLQRHEYEWSVSSPTLRVHTGGF